MTACKKRDERVPMEEQKHLWNILGITNNIRYGTSGEELEVTAE
jgi:hypothetical protein